VLCKQGSWEPAGRRCGTCQLRGRCTTAARGRVIVLHPHHTLLGAARALVATDAFSGTYRCHRPMAERSIAWLVQGANRRLRYRGIARKPALARPLCRRREPPAARQPRSHPPGRPLGRHLTGRTALGPVKEGRLYGTKATCAAGSTLKHRLFGRT